jgi:hypothetical protein
MKEYDIHGMTLDQVRDLTHQVVGASRLGKEDAWVKFITGHGVCQKEVISILEDYGLEPEIQWGNSGCVNVYVQ